MNGESVKKYIDDNVDILYEELVKARSFNIGKEENFRINYAIILNKIYLALGIDRSISIEQEYSVAEGRIDSLYGNFIIEYKYPTRITPAMSASNKSFIEQLKRHIIGLSAKNNIPEDRISGVVFDGHHIIYIKRRNLVWNISNPQIMTPESHGLFLMRLLSINVEGKALTASNLVKDFSAESSLAKCIIPYLYGIIHRNDDKNKPYLLFEQWKTLYREVCGYDFDTKDAKIQALKSFYAISGEQVDLACLIFAVQTYFAVLIKLLTIDVLTYFQNSSFKEPHILHIENERQLKMDLQAIEDGGRFRMLGIQNFLEGDFFGWYLYLWNSDMYQLFRDIIELLNSYDYSLITLEDRYTHDLLKKVYYELMPAALRRNLGEYYTPDWLAEFLISDVKMDFSPQKSILDPTCGSGTFIVLLIKKFVEANKNKLSKKDLLYAVLNNIKGYDLNPLAVICARANYIIALGELISEKEGEIEIPVYLCDSMLTILESYEEESRSYVIPTKAGIFYIPQALVDNDMLNSVLSCVNICVKRKLNACLFIDYLGKTLSQVFNILTESEIKSLEAFYETMLDLDNQRLDGIWTNIIKNAFAPIFQDKVDFIIGNPPWIDWQNLPESYCASIQKYWYDYKIFDHKGQKAQLGSSHDDISVLMTYVIMDNFLKDDGILGFVINQNLLQAYGGGDGFRKFAIKEKIPVKVLSVNDFVDVEPFRSLGASNKTAAIVLKKNDTTDYPVDYIKWKKVSRGVIDSDEELEDLLRNRLIAKTLKAVPITSANSPWMLGQESELPVFAKLIKKGAKASAYRARKGVDTSANAIFWLKEKRHISEDIVLVDNSPESSKKQINFVGDYPIDSSLLYPLLRGKDVTKWSYKPAYSILLPYNNDGKYIEKEDLLYNYPNTYDYFFNEANGFTGVLKARATYQKFHSENAPEYALYNIGEYTFAPYKVVWKALAGGIMATVISKYDNRLLIPDHNLLMVAFEDEESAYYLSGILNTKIVSDFVNAYVAWFFSAHILEHIDIPEYDNKNPLHRKLVELSKNAHMNFENGTLIQQIENELNDIVKNLFLYSQV